MGSREWQGGLLGFESDGQDIEDNAVLLAAGLVDGQHRFNEAATAGALGAEEEFVPDHVVTQHLFGSIVGRMNNDVAEEQPELDPAIYTARGHD